MLPLLLLALFQAALHPACGRIVPNPARQILSEAAAPKDKAQLNASNWDTLAQVGGAGQESMVRDLCVPQPYLTKVMLGRFLFVQGLIGAQESALTVEVWLTSSISISQYGSFQPLEIYRYA
jgi:hypothetical protein